jgi:hypothetical protein
MRVRVLVPIVACVAVSGVGLDATANAAEYAIKALPELGRCVRVAKHTGEYGDAACTRRLRGNTGKFDWLPGAGASKTGFTLTMSRLELGSTGASKASIQCEEATGQGLWETEKTSRLAKLTLTSCRNVDVAEKKWCQSGETLGEIDATALTGELGFIQNSRHVANVIVGLDLAGTIKFECEDVVEPPAGPATVVTGTGVKREVTGSVIGKVSPLDGASTSFATKLVVSGGKQSPVKFEGQPADTLTTLVTPLGGGGTPEATTLTGTYTLKNEQSLEIKAFCKARGGHC